ncbi:hypothetical protein [Melissococcus sp. OM08-11BH]|uniref:hypothetical protein n=1 Tax=Melissococcus sp. OM08-11BH TaxID=2293110 RepID=UPI000E4CC718|nr:hypothetical protein [Melissococcus sp. OM08-11BH]RGI31874.1 hypothetical protein DXC12_00805 [Melissococcus sp. OM08-11BH]
MEYTAEMINKLTSNRNISNDVLDKALKAIKLKREIIAIEKEIKILEQELKDIENAKRYVFKNDNGNSVDNIKIKGGYLNNMYEESEMKFTIGNTIPIQLDNNRAKNHFSFNDAA